ncbi:MAG: redox-sensing transcriptional repressor Rex [Spirochaetales bacterium]|nr:redox-sensing transcriptional repressor Rex [Spirochaetales bacterium]
MNKDLILRLSKYKRLLSKLKALGLERVFSNNLGDAIGVAPSLVRKDFSMLSLPGNKRGGYDINLLIEKLDIVLGRDKPQEVILAGCGRIGTALMQYEEFRNEGIKIIAGFDIAPENVSKTSGVPIYHIKDMKEFVNKNDTKVGIISVPDSAAASTLDLMIESGIKGILNFATIELRINNKDDLRSKANGCTIHNINICLELEHLFYQVNVLNETTTEEN